MTNSKDLTIISVGQVLIIPPSRHKRNPQDVKTKSNTNSIEDFHHAKAIGPPSSDPSR